MYVYLALLLGIVLVVWIYRKYLQRIEPFDLLADGVTKQVYTADCWNNRSCDVGPNDRDNFSPLPPGYSIFPIRITQKTLDSCVVHVRSMGTSFNCGWYVSSDIKAFEFQIKDYNITKKTQSNTLQFRTTKTATVTSSNIYDPDDNWKYNFRILTQTVTDSKNDEVSIIGTNYIFSTDFKYYRPATLGELSWLRLNSPTGSLDHYINSTTLQNYTPNSNIEFIVGPTPTNYTQNTESLLIPTYTKTDAKHQDIIDRENMTCPSASWDTRQMYMSEESQESRVEDVNWATFTYTLSIYIVGKPITSFDVPNAPTSVSGIDPIGNAYAQELDRDVALNSADARTYINYANTTLGPILKKYRLSGTKTFSRSCNIDGCRSAMTLMQAKYTGYDLQGLPECAGCLASDYRDISGVWKLADKFAYGNGIVFTNPPTSSGEITGSFVASDFTRNRAPTTTPMYLPAQTVATDETYVFQLYRVNRDASWTSNSTITNLITNNTQVIAQVNKFTVPAGKRINTFTVNLNTRTVSFPNTTNGIFTLPANTFFYHTYTAADRDKIGAAITADPVYTIRIYKMPQNILWNKDANGDVTDIVFDGWFGVKPRKITMERDNIQMYKYTAKFTDTDNTTNIVSLPTGTYTITLKARDTAGSGVLVPDKTLSVTAAGPFTGFDLNLSGAGTLTLNDTAKTSVQINEVYALRGGIPKFSIEIRAGTGNPIFAMDPISLDELTYNASIPLGSKNYDVVFAKGYSLSVSGTTQTLSFYLSHSKDLASLSAPISATFTNVQSVTGFRVKLNNTTGTGEFVFLTTDSAEIRSTLTTLSMIFTYDTITSLTVNITVANRQLIPSLPPNNIPPTSLTIGNVTTSGNTSGISGNVQFNTTSPTLLKRDSYTVRVFDLATTYLTFTEPLASELSSYKITLPNTLELFSAGNTPSFLTKTLSTSITADTSVQVSISNSTIGTLTTTPYNINALKITRTGTLGADGYVIRGNFTQGSANVNLSNIAYTIKLINAGDNNKILYTLQSNALDGASGYELNISKNTLRFTGTTVVLTLPTPFIGQVSGVTPMNLQFTLNDSISYETPLSLPKPEFAITQTSSGYSYEFPEPYALVKNSTSDYTLTLKSDNEFSPPYGAMVFKPAENTRKFTVNINTGEVAFISTGGVKINTFDVQGLRESTDTNLNAMLLVNGVVFPPNAAVTLAPIKSTKFDRIQGKDVYSASDNSTNVRVDFGAQTGSLSGSSPAPGSITPITQLEPNSPYTITVKRNNSDILFQSTFVTASDTSAIAAINYNRDANTILFIDAAGKPQPPNQTALDSQLTGSAAPDLRRMNNETINLEITQTIDYSSKANSASDGRTLPSSASGRVTKKVFAQTNASFLGVQKITTSWNKGYVIFTLTNGVGKSANLAPGEYVLTIKVNSNELPQIRFTVSTNTTVRYLRLNVFTGDLIAITNSGAIVSIVNTGILSGTSEMNIGASISLGGSPLYETAGQLKVPPFYEDCSGSGVIATTTDVFLLLDSDGKGFTRTEATSKSILGLEYATLADVKAAAKAGANWDTPGWILGDIDKPPVYPINEYSEIQIYAVPHRQYFTTNAPGPIPKGPYVISYLPVADAGEEPRAGILVKGDRTKVPAGFTVVKFNTYTGRPSLGEVAPSNEIFHISLPANTSWADARAKCKEFDGDIAIDTTVGAEGLKVPIGAQWPMYGFMYKLFVNNDVSNLVRIGHPTQPTTANKTGIFVLEGTYTTSSTANGVICYGSKRNMDRGNNELKFDTSGNPISSAKNVVSDYNYDRHIWSAYESVSPLAYESYMPKNIDAIAAEPNAYYKAAMIVNDGRAQPNIVFARGLQDAERYAGCDVRYMTCIAKSSDDPDIEKKYVAPTSSTGKWVNLDLENLEQYTTESFQGSRDAPLPAPGIARMMSDMELFGRTPVALEGLVGGVGELGVEDRPQIPLREPFVDGKVGVDDATRQAVNEILDCQAAGGAVNITMDKSVYPGCDTICCFPDDGRKLDPSLIKNRRKTSGPGAATCDDEGGCTESTSKAPIRHTPAPAAYRLKKKTGGPAATAPAPKCASATPLRTQVANAKRDKLEALRNKPVN